MNCADFNSVKNRAGFNVKSEPGTGTSKPDLDVFFSLTGDLRPHLSELEKLLSAEERSRAHLFHFDEDRDTYTACHAFLRMVLSARTGKDPNEILIMKDENTKPFMVNSEIHFNITHSKDAFAIAVSDNNYAGIDLEQLDRHFDVDSLSRTYFSDPDREFILTSDSDSSERFMLLWTRKEALLKAVGTGIITDLKKISVYQGEDTSVIKGPEALKLSIRCEDHVLYSKMLENHILSVAVPVETNIIFRRIDKHGLTSFFQNSGEVYFRR